jgi:hypothetical protein
MPRKTRTSTGDASKFTFIWNKIKIIWSTKGRWVSVVAATAIGIGGFAYLTGRTSTAKAATNRPTTQPVAQASGERSAASATASVQQVNGSGNITTQSGPADSHAQAFRSKANGPGAKAISGQNITTTENKYDSGAIEKGLEGKLDDWQPHKVNIWQADDQGDFIELPFTANRDTKITLPFAKTPFEGHNRRAVVELRRFTPGWDKKFVFQVKAMRLFGDQNRENGTAVAGREFTILRAVEGDEEFYLAWRGEESKEEFAEKNGDAMIVIRLLK